MGKKFVTIEIDYFIRNKTYTVGEPATKRVITVDDFHRARGVTLNDFEIAIKILKHDLQKSFDVAEIVSMKKLDL